MKKKMFKKVAASALALAILTPAALAATVYVGKDGGSLNLRAGKGTGYASTGYVVQGEEIAVLERGGEWWKISVARTGKSGYVRAAYVRDDDASIYIGPDGGSLNLRAGKGTNYSSTGYVVQGEAIRVLENSGEWSKIEVKRTGKVGYIRSSYLRGEIPTPPPSSSVSSYEPALLTTKTLDGSVHLRASASTGAASLGTLKRGDFLKGIGRSGDWIKVVTTNNKTGYVRKDFISFGVGATTTGDVNFRSGPGTNYGRIRTLLKGAPITVLKVDGNWAQVRSGRDNGYISASYFSF